jgi:hypothetical protein
MVMVSSLCCGREILLGEEDFPPDLKAWELMTLLGVWTRNAIPAVSPPTQTGSRGSICVDRQDNLHAVLPGNIDSSLSILRSRKCSRFRDFELLWTGDGFDGEPLVDIHGLETSNTLSIFTQARGRDDGSSTRTIVLDFQLHT